MRGFFAALRMTTSNSSWRFERNTGVLRYAQNDGKNNSNCKMRGSLHFATHDETVSRFGRDDAVWVWLKGEAKKGRRVDTLRPCCLWCGYLMALPVGSTYSIGARLSSLSEGSILVRSPTATMMRWLGWMSVLATRSTASGV